MLCIENLLSLELFQSLPRHKLEWICERATEILLKSGEVLLREGDLSRGFFVMAAGRIGISRQSDGIDMPIGQHEGAGFFGELSVLTDEPIMVTFRALTNCRFYEISAADFRNVMHECRDFERIIFRTIQQRMRGLESFIQSREKMAALGTLAAGLAHELNNPAAALVRALRAIPEALEELQRMNLVYGKRQVDDAHTQEWLKVRDDGYAAILQHRFDSISVGDREERLLEWLEAYGVEDSWKLAEPLALGGIEPETLNTLLDRWRNDPTELRDMGAKWLALSFDVMHMIASGLRGAERIAELVQSMKSYTYLDRGAQQIIDIHEGLEDTLRLLSHRLKQGIEVRRVYDQSLPQIFAYGSELNQVWTNLLDNAIDAIHAVSQTGIIEIVTTQQGNQIQVRITDSGQGIPAEIHSRIFEPFFTTKTVGQGSGLGLDVVRRVVENRHQGSISAISRPGCTSFTVCLPIQLTHSASPDFANSTAAETPLAPSA